jgi:hypothetical protein
VVADGLAGGLAAGRVGAAPGSCFEGDLASATLSPPSLDRATTSVYMAALAHFDLLRPRARQA